MSNPRQLHRGSTYLVAKGILSPHVITIVDESYDYKTGDNTITFAIPHCTDDGYTIYTMKESEAVEEITSGKWIKTNPLQSYIDIQKQLLSEKTTR